MRDDIRRRRGACASDSSGFAPDTSEEMRPRFFCGVSGNRYLPVGASGRPQTRRLTGQRAGRPAFWSKAIVPGHTGKRGALSCSERRTQCVCEAGLNAAFEASLAPLPGNRQPGERLRGAREGACQWLFALLCSLPWNNVRSNRIPWITILPSPGAREPVGISRQRASLLPVLPGSAGIDFFPGGSIKQSQPAGTASGAGRFPARHTRRDLLNLGSVTQVPALISMPGSDCRPLPG